MLGPLELVADDGTVVDVPGGKPRLLLALLALEAGRVVSMERLVDGLWGEQPPATSAKVVLGYVSRLRKLLSPGMLETHHPGYILRLGGQFDLERFESLRREASAASAEARWHAAASLLAEALALWRGPPLADVADEIRLPGELARLDELRLAAIEERVDADLQLGREAELVPELEALTRLYPLRERLRAQLMLALYRLGRQADALELYRETRQLLVDELGIDPGPELQRLERQILVQDEALAPAGRVQRARPVPAALTPLVGRVQEVAELGKLLRRSDVRLLTLVGPGGVGKTRLALAVAELWPEAVLVLLAPVEEPRFAPSAIAGALGLKDETELADWLSPRELLLVLDNFEHVLEAAPIVTDLLSAAPGLRVLATSREPLNLSGEHRYAVSPLGRADAVDLFIERAAAAGAAVEPTAAVEEICRRLDCLPLALELAAARARTLPPEQLLARLETRLTLLTRGPRDAPERQRTLRAAIEWSYALLTPDEQSAFARLAVFAGGCTLDAAEQVCDASLETLDSLVDKSLLKLDGERFTMLETILEYAREHLGASEDGEWMSRRLVEHLHDTAVRFSNERERGYGASLAELESELDNIRTAMRAALEWGDDPQALRLSAALQLYWSASGRYAEGLRWTTEALERAGRVRGAPHAEGLRAATVLASLAADPERACAYGEEALALYRANGDDYRLGSVLPWLADAYSQIDNAARSRELHAESIALHERLGDSLRLARALRIAGEDELAIGDPARATDLFNRSLALAKAAQSDNDVVMTLHSFGDVSIVRGDAAGAAGYYLHALGVSTESAPVVYCLAGLAVVGALEQLAESSGRLWGAVESHQQRLGDPVIHPNTLRRYEPILKQVEGPVFDSAVAAGRSLTLDAAVLEAVETFGAWAVLPPSTGLH